MCSVPPSYGDVSLSSYSERDRQKRIEIRSIPL
jgi:hypothetical protein